MKKAFTPTFRISGINGFQKNVIKKLSLSCAVVMLSLFNFISFGQVSGTVFRDINGNTTKDNSTSFTENGVAGVTVKAYKPAGAVVGTATTSAIGTYTIASVSGKLRIEFTNFPDGQFEGPNGLGSKTSVQFVTGPATNVDLGINCPEQYNTNANPKVYIPCFVNGNPLGGGTSGTDIGFVSFNFADQSVGTTPGPDTGLTTTSKLGSVWAVAYSPQAKLSFTSAFLKRHSGMGPLGSGGIYTVSPTGTVTNWLDFDGIGIPTNGTGTYGTTVTGQTVTFSPVIGTNTQRGLPANKAIPNNDPAAFDQVGKVSFGGMDLSADGQFIYIVNLFDKKVYQIDVTNPTNPVAPTATNKASKIKSWAIPNPGCTNGVARPWACKYYKGKVYIGVVCSGENGGTEADIKQYVYTLDPATGFNTTPVLTVPNYTMQLNNDPASWAFGQWTPWTNTMVNGSTAAGTGATAVYWGEQSPMLSDIEFDVEGSMIISIMCRAGHQGGVSNYPPSGTTFVVTSTAGDVLRASPNSTMTSWTLENNGDKDGSGSYVAITAQKDGSGPGGGEFYYQDNGGDNGGGNYWHLEVADGALAFVPGTNTVAINAMDAIDFFSGGVFFLNNTTGKTDRRLGIFPNLNNTDATYFGKAIGLGDMDFVREIPPIEIGNRIWKDTDKDGIQDADELPLVGVKVILFNSSGIAVDTATTDVNGNYIFSSKTDEDVLPNTAYSIKVVDLGSDASVADLLLTNLTIASGETSAANTGKSLNNNDAFIVSGLPTINFTTGNLGDNNHTLDFGFIFICPNPNCGTVTVTKN